MPNGAPDKGIGGIVGIGRKTALFAIAVGLAVAPIAFAAAPDPRLFVQNLGNQVLDILKTPNVNTADREQRFHALFLADFDSPTIARFVLGAQWRNLNDEQRKRYLDVFADYVASIYAIQFSHYSGEKFEIVGESKRGGDDTFVDTKIDRPNEEPLDVVYRIRDEQNSPKIIDVVVDAVSLIVTKRSEFASVLQHDGFDGLMQRMQATVAQTRGDKS